MSVDGAVQHVAPQGTPKAVRNSTLSLVSQGLYAVLHLVSIAILARALGMADFGRYFTIFALVLVVQLAMELGLGTALTRRLAPQSTAANPTTAQAWGLFLWVALASALVLLAAGAAVDTFISGRGHLRDFAFAAVACAALQVQRFCTGVFRAFEVFAPENIARILQGACFTLLLVATPLLQPVSLGSALAAFAASHVLATAWLLAAYWRRWRFFGCSLSLAHAREWVREAVPVGIGDTVRGLTWQLDTVLLGWMRPAAEVGIYSVAYRPLGPLNWIPRAVTAATFTSFARLAQTDRAQLARSFSATVRVLWVVSLIPAVLFFVCAEAVVRTLAGAAYLEAVIPLRIVIWVACFSFMSYPLGAMFAATGQPRLYARLAILTFSIELALEALLIPFWGYLGACFGSFTGELFFTAAGLALCRRQGLVRLEWHRLAGAALAALAAGAALWPMRHLPLGWLSLAVAGSTLLYVAMCVALGALAREEVTRLVQAILKRVPAAAQQASRGAR